MLQRGCVCLGAPPTRSGPSDGTCGLEGYMVVSSGPGPFFAVVSLHFTVGHLQACLVMSGFSGDVYLGFYDTGAMLIKAKMHSWGTEV